MAICSKTGTDRGKMKEAESRYPDHLSGRQRMGLLSYTSVHLCLCLFDKIEAKNSEMIIWSSWDLCI